VAGPFSQIERRRRQLVKRWGKRLFRRVDGFLARQSLVPNDPLLDPALFPWLDVLRERSEEIGKELERLLERRESLPNFQDISPDQRRISPDDKWRSFVFYGFGVRSEQNCRLCPVTAEVLDGVPGIENAFFSILAPGKFVPSHKGVTKGMIRVHLGLEIPEESERCTMTIDGIRCTWRRGDVLVFDDTHPHQVSNDTSEQRSVLLLDFQRPMTRRGRLVVVLLRFLLKRSAYFKDARRNQQAFEKRYRELFLRGRAVG
jgi:aspartyl/asparaginyl beta-hydroxylase (cupin superfamily)